MNILNNNIKTNKKYLICTAYSLKSVKTVQFAVFLKISIALVYSKFNQLKIVFHIINKEFYKKVVFKC